MGKTASSVAFSEELLAFKPTLSFGCLLAMAIRAPYLTFGKLCYRPIPRKAAPANQLRNIPCFIISYVVSIQNDWV